MSEKDGGDKVMSEKRTHTPGCKEGWRISGCLACENAINSHDSNRELIRELLDAAKEALKRGNFAFNGKEDKYRVEDLLSQAIAKAEGRS